jgi:hypothetical protein
MPCNPLTDPACVIGSVIKSAASGAAGDVLSGIAHAIGTGVRWVVTNTATWWVRLPSPDLTAEPAVTHIQQWLLPITAAVAVAGVIAAGVRMALTRRANPLLDVTGGLLTVAAASTVGMTAVTLLLKAGDAWSTWVLQVSTGGHFVQRLNLVLQLGGGAAAAVVLVFGLVAIVMSLLQAILMLFRQVALLILAGVLPLAAAGSIAPMTRTWVRKVTAWMLALICYKPAAAAVYAAAFTMVGSGRSPRTTLLGFVMMLLSVLMLPALMKFFTWTTGTIGSSGGGGGQLLGAATMGAIAFGAIRPSGAGPAQGQAAHINSSLGPLPPNGGAESPPSGPPSGPSGGSGSTPDGGPTGGAQGASPTGAGGRPVWPNAGPKGGWSPWAGAGANTGGPSGSAGTPTGSAEASAGSGSAAPTSAPGPGSVSSGGAAASGAASGAGPAATVASEAAKAATQAGHLAEGAMNPGDRS